MANEKKMFSTRLDLDVLDKLAHYSFASGTPMADFVSAAIMEKCEKEQILRSGGMMMTIPNPQFIRHNGEQAAIVVGVLSDSAKALSDNNPGLGFGLHKIAAFAQERLYQDSDAQKKIFAKNLAEDSEE